jgi:predicted MPP superfamily phosphohydrolase
MTKIALLGDIHVGILGRGKEFAVSGEINQDDTDGAASLIDGLITCLTQEKVDYLFVSGDLTSTGSPMEYTKCLEILQKISKSAAINSNNIVLSLGNHDVDRRISGIPEMHYAGAKSSPKIFDQITEQYQKIASCLGSQFLQENSFDVKGPAPFSGVIHRDSLHIFVLNSGWFCSANKNMSHGKLHEAQLR